MAGLPAYQDRHIERALQRHEGAQRSLRFGHSNDFSDLFSDSKSDYILGIGIASLILSSIFFCWVVLLCIFQRQGKEKFGYLSGAPYDAYTKEGNKNKRNVRGRVVFVFSSIAFVGAAATCLSLGIPSLKDASHHLSHSARFAGNMLSATQAAMGPFVQHTKKVLTAKPEVIEMLEDAFEIKDAKNSTSIVFDEVDFKELAMVAVQALKAMDPGGSQLQESQDMHISLDLEGGFCLDVTDGLQMADFTLINIACILAMLIIPFLLLALLKNSSITAGRRNHERLQGITTWFMLSLFALLIMLIWLMTSVFAILTIGNADFCYNPDVVVLSFVESTAAGSANSFQYRHAQFVIQECQGVEDPMKFMHEFSTQLQNAHPRLLELTNLIDTVGVGLFNNHLDYDMRIVQKRLQPLVKSMHEAQQELKVVLADLNCGLFYDIYRNTVHRAACQDATSSFFWTSTSLFFMTLFGLLMLTFRSTLYPVADESGYSDDGKGGHKKLTELTPLDEEGQSSTSSSNSSDEKDVISTLSAALARVTEPLNSSDEFHDEDDEEDYHLCVSGNDSASALSAAFASIRSDSDDSSEGQNSQEDVKHRLKDSRFV